MFNYIKIANFARNESISRFHHNFTEPHTPFYGISSIKLAVVNFKIQEPPLNDFLQKWLF